VKQSPAEGGQAEIATVASLPRDDRQSGATNGGLSSFLLKYKLYGKA